MMLKRMRSYIISFMLAFCLLAAGCSDGVSDSRKPDSQTGNSSEESAVASDEGDAGADSSEAGDVEVCTGTDTETDSETGTETITLSNIPDYSGSAYIEINGNIPYFTEDEITTDVFEIYSELDEYGRCGVAFANICREIMPTESRGEIGSVKPTGWHTVKYAGIDGNYLYNRCHLIAYELAAENANEENLITGTRYLNVEGMLPFENSVADYVYETDNHVLYRVTPIFEEDNLLASGVLMEAMSVEDDGEGILFCVYCYNVQPGIGIDYATGESWEEESSATQSDSDGTDESPNSESEPDSGQENPDEITETQTVSAEKSEMGMEDEDEGSTGIYTYILNTNTGKFHYPDCSAVSRMSEKNKQEYTGTRDEVIAQGYYPCGLCNP